MFKSDYIHNCIINETLDYYGTDTPDIQNPNWTEPISYRFNSIGFRSREITDIENSVVTFGCSHAMGVGVPEEKRFGDLIAKQLNLTPYNFGIGGKDFSCVSHNVLVFLNECIATKKFPKHIIIMWPDIGRFTWLRDYIDFHNFCIETELPSAVKEYSWQSNFIVKWEERVAIIYLLQCMRAIDLICKSNNVNLLQQIFSFFKFENADIDSFKICPELIHPTEKSTIVWDYGRDRHPGPITHQKIADSYLKFII